MLLINITYVTAELQNKYIYSNKMVLNRPSHSGFWVGFELVLFCFGYFGFRNLETIRVFFIISSSSSRFSVRFRIFQVYKFRTHSSICVGSGSVPFILVWFGLSISISVILSKSNFKGWIINTWPHTVYILINFFNFTITNTKQKTVILTFLKYL